MEGIERFLVLVSQYIKNWYSGYYFEIIHLFYKQQN